MKFALLLSAVLFVSACQSVGKPALAHLEQETVSPEFLMQSLLQRQADIKTLRSFIQTTVEKGSFKQSMRQTLVLCDGDAIRVDTFSPFGQAMWVFMHNSGGALLYDNDNNRIYRGADVGNIMEQVTGMVVDFKEIINVFSGNIPRLESHHINRAFLEKEKNSYQLETVNASGLERYEIDLDAEGLFPTKWVRFMDDRRVYSVTWNNYKMVEDRRFPHHINIKNLEGKETLDVYYQSPKINVELSPNTFELPGLGKVRLSCRSANLPGEARAVQ